MSITKNLNLTPSADSKAVAAYLQAQESKDFSASETFMSDDVYFNGLVLNQKGRMKISQAMAEFLPAIKTLALEAATQIVSGDTSEYLVLYNFQIHGQKSPQSLCDRVVVRDGLITRIDNVFDLAKLPQP